MFFHQQSRLLWTILEKKLSKAAPASLNTFSKVLSKGSRLPTSHHLSGSLLKTRLKSSGFVGPGWREGWRSASGNYSRLIDNNGLCRVAKRNFPTYDRVPVCDLWPVPIVEVTLQQFFFPFLELMFRACLSWIQCCFNSCSNQKCCQLLTLMVVFLSKIFL